MKQYFENTLGRASFQAKVARLIAEKSAKQLANFFETSVELMKILARACGHDDLTKFTPDDIITWKREMSELSGVKFGGVGL